MMVSVQQQRYTPNGPSRVCAGSSQAEPSSPASESRAQGPASREDQQKRLIGSRLRSARVQAGLGVRELSRRLDISASMISQIELGRVAPSVSTLYMLATTLDISTDSLFFAESSSSDLVEDVSQSGRENRPKAMGQAAFVRGPSNESSFIQRAGRRRSIDLNHGVRWELLTPKPEPGAEFIEVSYPVGGASNEPSEAIRHSGRDYALVLSGTLSVQIGFEQFTLQVGDSMAFDGTIPHRLWNAGSTAVRSVWFVLDRLEMHS